MVILLQDHPRLRQGYEYIEQGESPIVGGPSCPLFVSTKTSQRVSYSTSHSETNPCVSCAAVTNVLASRITETEFYPLHGRHPTAQDLLELQSSSNNTIPTDIVADAMGVALRVYGQFDLAMSVQARAAIERHVAANPKGKHGRHEYSLEQFGLEPDAVLKRFEGYIERFGIDVGR